MLVLLVLVLVVVYWVFPRGSPVAKEQVFRVKNPAIHFTPTGDGFVVEGEEKKILSGAIHYFRVVPAYWEDRLMKLKAAGLNTVET